MAYQQSISAYLNAAAQGATQITLIQIAYEHLAHDLLQAADAARRGDVKARCLASNHSFSITAHLETWAKEMDESALSESLLIFYNFLRSSVLRLQSNPNAEEFTHLAELVLIVRATWHEKERMLQAMTAKSVEEQTPQRALSLSA